MTPQVYMKSKRYSLPIFIVLIVTSCGGGNGEGDSVLFDGSPSPTGKPFPLRNANGDIKGSVWIPGSHPIYGATLNLASGEYRSVSQHVVFPRSDGQEYIEIVDEYRTHPKTGCRRYNSESDSILIRDSVIGLVENAISAENSGLDFLAAAQLSPDGQRVGVFAQGDDWCLDDDGARLMLFNRSGELVIVAKDFIKSFDWLPDNRQVFAIDDDDSKSISVESEPDTLQYQEIANLDDIEGHPRNVRASADGRKVVFEMTTGVPAVLATVSYRNSTVWQFNIDGTELEQVLDSSRAVASGVPRINSPVYSPDGEWLLATENYLSGVNTTFYGTETENLTYIEAISTIPVSSDSLSYVMPSNSGYQQLPPASFDANGIRPLLSSNERPGGSRRLTSYA